MRVCGPNHPHPVTPLARLHAWREEIKEEKLGSVVSDREGVESPVKERLAGTRV